MDILLERSLKTKKRKFKMEDSESDSALQFKESTKKLVIWICKAVPRTDYTRVDVHITMKNYPLHNSGQIMMLRNAAKNTI